MRAKKKKEMLNLERWISNLPLTPPPPPRSTIHLEGERRRESRPRPRGSLWFPAFGFRSPRITFLSAKRSDVHEKLRKCFQQIRHGRSATRYQNDRSHQALSNDYNYQFAEIGVDNTENKFLGFLSDYIVDHILVSV